MPLVAARAQVPEWVHSFGAPALVWQGYVAGSRVHTHLITTKWYRMHETLAQETELETGQRLHHPTPNYLLHSS